MADVCIVGGGYCGLSTALHLAERGIRAVVLGSAPDSGGVALVAAVTPDSGLNASELIADAAKAGPAQATCDRIMAAPAEERPTDDIARRHGRRL